MALLASICITILCFLVGSTNGAILINSGDKALSSRRDVFLSSRYFIGAAFFAPPPTPSSSSSAAETGSEEFFSSVSPAAIKLLTLIPNMRYDAPATNATLPRDLSMEIEAMASSLEDKGQSNNAKSPFLQGNWKLIYSNAPEITSLATNLPLGFQLGKTLQPVLLLGRFENQCALDHPLKLAHWQTNVIGTVSVAPPGTLNAVGIVNDRSNRVEVDFSVLVFLMDEILGRPVHFQKTLIPKPLAKDQAHPANDITYLEENFRIVRGGDGALFIFVRDKDIPLLTSDDEEREALLGKASSGKPNNNNNNKNNDDRVDVGIGMAEKSSSPELQFLFKQRITK